jgi:hypothetical protein
MKLPTLLADLRTVLTDARTRGDKFGAATIETAIRVLETSTSQGRARTPQLEIATELRQRGIEVKTEVRLRSLSPKSRSGLFRADIAVYRRGQIVALCECKATRRELRGRQREHYDGAGVPYIVAGGDDIDEAVAWLCARAEAEDDDRSAPTKQ